MSNDLRKRVVTCTFSTNTTIYIIWCHCRKWDTTSPNFFLGECSGRVLIKFIKSFLVTRLFQMSFVLVFFFSKAGWYVLSSVFSPKSQPSLLFSGKRYIFSSCCCCYSLLMFLYVCVERVARERERVEIFMWFSNFGLAFCLLLVLYGAQHYKKRERERERFQVINHWKQWQ